MAANEFIELFCELIVARLQIIAKRRFAGHIPFHITEKSTNDRVKEDF